MIQHTLRVVEEQTVRIGINKEGFLFRFFPFRNLMYVDIEKTLEYGKQGIAYGKRVMANEWLLPNYVAEGIGNIRFETYAADKDDYVWFEGFNSKFRLVSYNADEIGAL